MKISIEISDQVFNVISAAIIVISIFNAFSSQLVKKVTS